MWGSSIWTNLDLIRGDEIFVLDFYIPPENIQYTVHSVHTYFVGILVRSLGALSAAILKTIEDMSTPDSLLLVVRMHEPAVQKYMPRLYFCFPESKNDNQRSAMRES